MGAAVVNCEWGVDTEDGWLSGSAALGRRIKLCGTLQQRGAVGATAVSPPILAALRSHNPLPGTNAYPCSGSHSSPGIFISLTGT